MIARPARVRMRARKPCLRALRRVLGWNVRFTVTGYLLGKCRTLSRARSAELEGAAAAKAARARTNQGYGVAVTNSNRSGGRRTTTFFVIQSHSFVIPKMDVRRRTRAGLIVALLASSSLLRAPRIALILSRLLYRREHPTDVGPTACSAGVRTVVTSVARRTSGFPQPVRNLWTWNGQWSDRCR